MMKVIIRVEPSKEGYEFAFKLGDMTVRQTKFVNRIIASFKPTFPKFPESADSHIEIELELNNEN